MLHDTSFDTTVDRALKSHAVMNRFIQNTFNIMNAIRCGVLP